MKFITFINTTNSDQLGPIPQALIEAINQLGRDAGLRMLETGGMSDTGTIKVHKSQVITDGPFTEAKEFVGGYAIYELGSEQEVMDWTKRFAELHPRHWPAWEGEITVQQLHSFPVPPAA